MQTTEMIKVNKKCWDVVAPKFFGVEALPEYGPFTVTEDEINLFDTIHNKKVFEIGCGSGHSLQYMAEKGAQKLWGIDLSSTQIETARKTLKDFDPQLICTPMEEEMDVPKNYFDIVYSIYALGWSTNLSRTLELIYSHLKADGSLIFSWEHPMYPRVKSEDGALHVKGTYQYEGPVRYESFYGEQVPVVLHRRKLGTYINKLVEAGFKIEKVIEGDVSKRFINVKDDFSEENYSLYKTRAVPNTFIIKARK